eukprot:835707_1
MRLLSCFGWVYVVDGCIDIVTHALCLLSCKQLCCLSQSMCIIMMHYVMLPVNDRSHLFIIRFLTDLEKHSIEMAYFYLVFLVIQTAMSLTKYLDEDCVRLRKPLHRLTEDERMLYVKGYQALRRSGKLDIISTTHAANVAVHKGASFFFLHAYMIWEAETAIRQMGEEYKCFAMPYWDYTRDSGLESDPTIFHLNVGADGNRQNDFCMDDPLWSSDNYWSTDAYTCMNDETRNPPRCCLKRSVSDTQLLPSAAQIASVYIHNSNYLLFETQIDHFHVWPHFYLAVNTWSQMATAYAVDDPIFFLLHTFTLYQRALWTTCYQYDDIDVSELQKYPDAYTPSCNPNMLDCGVVGLDAPYNLQGMTETDWALAAKMDLTPRMFYDIEDWNVQYDFGDFYYKSKLNEWCPVDIVNPDWFVSVSYVDADAKDAEYHNPLQEFIDETWDDLKAQQDELGLTDEEVYFAVESISCKHHRKTSPNSCYNEDAAHEYETCASQDIYDPDISLDDMLQFDGVKQNECLTKRRKQIYAVADYDYSIPLQLCNGAYDYQCPEFEMPRARAKELQLNRARVVQSELQFVSWYNSDGYKIMVLFSLCIFAVLSVIIIKCCHTNPKENTKQDIEYGTFAVC